MKTSETQRWLIGSVCVPFIIAIIGWVFFTPTNKPSDSITNKTQITGLINSGNTVTNNIYNFYSNGKEISDIFKSLIQNKKGPNIEVIDPLVAIVNYTDIEGRRGLVKAGFQIPLINTGDTNAKDLTVKWKIYDEGNYITSPDEYFKTGPMGIADFPSNKGTMLLYAPDIGCTGQGTIKLILDYSYTNPLTGEKVSKQFVGSAKYKANKDDKVYPFPLI